jgi:hypothetical protein
VRSEKEADLWTDQSWVFILMPVIIPLSLAIGIAALFIASGTAYLNGQQLPAPKSGANDSQSAITRR